MVICEDVDIYSNCIFFFPLHAGYDGKPGAILPEPAALDIASVQLGSHLQYEGEQLLI